jgi:hypothetical protein
MGMEYHGNKLRTTCRLRIERGMVIPTIRSWTLLVSQKKGYDIDVYGSMIKYLRRMHMDHYGPSGRPDDHLSESVLGNVWSVLESWVTRLRDQFFVRLLW